MKDLGAQWLLKSEDPSIRYFALTDILDETEDSPEVEKTRSLIPHGDRVRTLLTGQQRDGGFGVHPYQKWTGAHWRLVSLVELGVPEGFRPAVKGTDLVLSWLLGDAHLGNIPRINGRYRRCASQEGNALAVCSRLGLATDPRVRKLALGLLEWQWPDGGWNCDRTPKANHSSVNESLSTMWGLVEYYRATRDDEISDRIDRCSEFFLKHHLFQSDHTGELIHPTMIKLHYPVYWHTDILQELVILMRAGKISDPRTREALDLLEEKRQPDGTWRPEASYWTRRRTPLDKARVLTSGVEVVNWGRSGPNEFLTLNALRVLKAAGRLKNSP